MHLVVMGVSGTGKSSVARGLADELGLELIEGDNFHPPGNIRKMTEGISLSDADRRPWLEKLASLVAARHAGWTSTVLTCSALRRSYREVLRGSLPRDEVLFLHLHAGFDVLEPRMSSRTGHFMPASLLRSQLDTLEELGPDETGVVVDVEPPLDVVLATALQEVRRHYGVDTGPRSAGGPPPVGS